MTVDELPVTDGSLAHDDVDRAYRVEVRYGVVRWRPVGGPTHGHHGLITPEQLAARGPVIDLVAPAAEA